MGFPENSFPSQSPETPNPEAAPAEKPLSPYAEAVFGELGGIVDKYQDLFGDEGIESCVSTVTNLAAELSSIEDEETGEITEDPEATAAFEELKGHCRKIVHDNASLIDQIRTGLESIVAMRPLSASEDDSSLSTELHDRLLNDLSVLAISSPDENDLESLLGSPTEQYAHEMIRKIAKFNYAAVLFFRKLQELLTYHREMLAEGENMAYGPKSHRHSPFNEQIKELNNLTRVFELAAQGGEREAQELEEKEGVSVADLINQADGDEYGALGLFQDMHIAKAKPLQEPWESRFNQLEGAVGIWKPI